MARAILRRWRWPVESLPPRSDSTVSRPFGSGASLKVVIAVARSTSLMRDLQVCHGYKVPVGPDEK